MSDQNALGVADERLGRLAYAALLTGQVGQSLTMVMLPAVLPQIAAYFGGGAHGELIAQQIAVFPFLGLAIGGILSGTVIGLLGLGKTVLVSALVYILSGIVPIFAVSAPPILLAALMLGTSASLLTSAISGIAGSILSGERLAKLVGYQVALGMLAGAAVGVSAAIAAQSLGWRAPFAGYAIVGAVILALSFAALPPANKQNTGTARTIETIRTVWPVYALAFLVFIAATLQPTWAPPSTSRHFADDLIHST